MTTSASTIPTGTRGITDTRISDEIRVVGMVWERELIRYVRTRTRIVSGLVQPVLFLFVLGYGMSGWARPEDSISESSSIRGLWP